MGRQRPWLRGLPFLRASLQRCARLEIQPRRTHGACLMRWPMPSVGSCSLPLPKGVSSLRRGPGVRLWCRGLQWNRHHGLSGWSILWPWCCCDGSKFCPRDAPPGDRAVGAPLSAKSYVELGGGVLDHGSQRW
jgi:hypothetical protein